MDYKEDLVLCLRIKNGKFGVRDTRDSVVEYYTSEKLDKIKVECGIRIFGSSKNG